MDETLRAEFEEAYQEFANAMSTKTSDPKDFEKLLIEDMLKIEESNKCLETCLNLHSCTGNPS